MHRMGVNTVLAIDVGSKDDDNFTNYGDKLSGWWLLYKKWNYWTTPVKIPDLTEIQSRLAYVSCQRILETVKKSSYCEYMRPPIDKYRTLQFGQFNEIKECGYNYGKILFNTWMNHSGSIEKFLYKKANRPINNAFSKKSKDSSPEKRSGEKVASAASMKNYQFEDLSQFVCLTREIAEPADQGSKKTKSILKLVRTGSEKNLDLLVAGNTRSGAEYMKQRHRFRQSKSVQINNEDHIYGKIPKDYNYGKCPISGIN